MPDAFDDRLNEIFAARKARQTEERERREHGRAGSPGGESRQAFLERFRDLCGRVIGPVLERVAASPAAPASGYAFEAVDEIKTHGRIQLVATGETSVAPLHVSYVAVFETTGVDILSNEPGFRKASIPLDHLTRAIVESQVESFVELLP
jgi:hypothetical protein